MHPEADEAVCCLTGAVRLHLRPTGPGGAEETVRLRAGSAVIVPRGRWHRVRLDAPSDLMSLTLRQGTRPASASKAKGNTLSDIRECPGVGSRAVG
ncbi:hypothetical protein HEP81_01142 [Streptomyces griseofuscus]|uniref:Cupin type-2 domain-containing protein n=1 Tax=Streptomyces griseofuscus TaxID=146922 RepID=A0A7H1PTU3_9ACTN|nr:hypothetical protein HEP81_01142 [Streptomyces griseofuscus]